MTRGRKKDLTLEPSRALAQQRDYRQRKAQYITGLEERLKTVESENAQLRAELQKMTSSTRLPAAFGPQTAYACAELMDSLASASSSLAKFNELAFNESTFNNRAENSTSHPALRPASFPSPAPSPPYLYREPLSSKRARVHSISRSRSRSRSPPSRPVHPYWNQSQRSATPPDATEHASPVSTSSSECCGGYVDCDPPAEVNKTTTEEPHASTPQSANMRFSKLLNQP